MRYVVLGSSAAGINAVRELRKLDKTGEIILVSKDETVYSRCILHHYLSGKRSLEELNFAENDFEELYQVQWIKGNGCKSLDREKQCIVLEDGKSVAYDKLLIATGSKSIVPPVKNLKQARNKIGFRNIEDIEYLKETSKAAEHIVIMGAGLVGIDCASGFTDLGKKACIIDMADWMLNKQLDEESAKTYMKAFAEKGMEQHYGVKVLEVHLDEKQNIYELLLDNGIVLPCDLLVLASGVAANIDFLAGSGITVNEHGLIFDETGKTNDERIYGAGDVSGTSPIWPAAVKEGIVAAGNMAGGHNKYTDFFASKSTMNYLGIATMSLGEVHLSTQECEIDIRKTVDSYKKILHKDGKILGAVIQGDLSYTGILQQLIARKIDVRKVNKPLFDIDYSDFFHIKDNFEFYYENHKTTEDHTWKD